MALERTICCCGASTWTRVIAWIQIVGNTLMLIGSITSLVTILSYYSDLYTENEASNKSVVTSSVAISIVFAFLGIIMGIILLKGTNQKRVGYLRAWLIYGSASLAVSIVNIVLNSISSSTDTIMYTIITGVVLVAINIFTLAVVYIHIKEIDEGVFDVRRQRIVTL